MTRIELNGHHDSQMARDGVRYIRKITFGRMRQAREKKVNGHGQLVADGIVKFRSLTRGPTVSVVDGEVYERLSVRQLEVLTLIAMGKSYKEIGQELSISEQSVKNHISNRETSCVLERLGAVDQVHAALIALDTGMLDIDQVTQGYNFSRFRELTAREVDILQAMTREHGRFASHKEIGRHLGIRYQTVKNHLANIFEKLEPDDYVTKARAAVLFTAYQRKAQ